MSKFRKAVSVFAFLSVVAFLVGTIRIEAKELPELNEIVVNDTYEELESALQNRVWSSDELNGALVAAAGTNKVDAAILLLDSGASTAYTSMYQNALTAAVVENSVQVTEILLERGFDPDFKSLFDWRPLHLAVRERYSHDEILILLLDHGAEVDAATNLRVTPLHRAAGFCKGSAVTILLSHGADKLLLDKYGQTAKQRAEKAGCSDVANLLR